jgi:hypothetical protein
VTEQAAIQLMVTLPGLQGREYSRRWCRFYRHVAENSPGGDRSETEVAAVVEGAS